MISIQAYQSPWLGGIGHGLEVDRELIHGLDTDYELFILIQKFIVLRIGFICILYLSQR